MYTNLAREDVLVQVYCMLLGTLMFTQYRTCHLLPSPDPDKESLWVKMALVSDVSPIEIWNANDPFEVALQQLSKNHFPNQRSCLLFRKTTDLLKIVMAPRIPNEHRTALRPSTSRSKITSSAPLSIGDSNNSDLSEESVLKGHQIIIKK